jgi:predicted GIY-YIG superfamily endonuclease
MGRQLWFWPPPRPLGKRFGAEFFRHVPESPGVYFMCGPDAGVLYVGSAKNLRRRLASYRTANSERLPRRIVRLLRQVTRIEWDVCASEAAARWREELLICVLEPKFNRAGKVWPSPDAWRALPTNTQDTAEQGRTRRVSRTVC